MIHYGLSPNAGFKFVSRWISFEEASCKASSKLFMELHQAKISKLRVNGQSRVPNYRENRLWFDVSDLRSGKNNRVEIEFERDYAKDGAGLHRFVDPEDSQVYLYTQGEVYNAQKYFLAFDQPDLKGTFKLSAEAPKEWRVLSNCGSQTSRGKNNHAVEFRRDFDYKHLSCGHRCGSLQVEGSYQDIQLRLFGRSSLKARIDRVQKRWFEITKSGLEFFPKAFGYEYPFGKKYDQVLVPEFNAGAMENTALVTFRESFAFRNEVITPKMWYGLANTILHEMVHMWFGNLVTMKWWGDLWLNESFAEAMAHWGMARLPKILKYSMDPWHAFGRRKSWAYYEDRIKTRPPL